MRKAIVLASSLAWLGLLALTVVSFVYPSMVDYGHISKPTAAGRCDWFYAYVHVNAGNSEWHFDGASNFNADTVSGGGFHWNRTSMFPPRFDAQGLIREPDGATEAMVSIAFPLWIPLLIFVVAPGTWAYRRRKLRKQTAGFAVTPV